MTLKRIFRGWFRGKAWREKRERRLEQWQQARVPPLFTVTRWSRSGKGQVIAEGSYRQISTIDDDEWKYCAEPFDVAFVDGKWYHRLHGNVVSSKRLLSFLEAEKVKREYPHIFHTETKSDM